MHKLDVDEIRYQAELRYAESKGDYSGAPRKLPSAQLDAVLCSIVEAINKYIERTYADRGLQEIK